MKRICFVVLYILLALTACTPFGSVSQIPTSEEFSQVEATQSTPEPMPEELPFENRVAAITPANGERIRKKKGENEDVVGWLMVPGTDIDSVIVQNPTNDISFYTTHDFAGNLSKDGTYCADYRCDFTTSTREGISQNIALYGHNWDENPDGRLFAQLKRFKESDFAEAHPYIFFSTEAEDMAWEVFAVYDVTVNQPYIIPDLPWVSLSEILDIACNASVLDYGIRLNERDKILTLSTCSFEVPGRTPLPLDIIPDYRFVVMARLISPDDVRKETAAFTVNDDPLLPDAMPTIYSHHADVIQYGGTLYNNLAIFHSDKIPEIDPASLIPVGEVARITFGGTTGLSGDGGITTPLSAGTWAYNCTGFFDSGNIAITGTLRDSASVGAQISQSSQPGMKNYDEDGIRIMENSGTWGESINRLLPYMSPAGVEKVVDIYLERHLFPGVTTSQGARQVAATIEPALRYMTKEAVESANSRTFAYYNIANELEND